MNETKIKKNKRKKIIVLILLLLLFLGMLGYYFFYPQSNSAKFREDSSAVSYNSSLKKPKNFTKSNIALPGFSKIVVEEGETETKTVLFNPSFNEVYFKYKVVFKKTGETLLETEAIAPGKAVIGFPLPDSLPMGEYPIVFEIKTYNKQTSKELNGGNSTTTLIVQKKSIGS